MCRGKSINLTFTTIPFASHPAYLDRIGQGDGDSEWQPLRNGHHQHSHADDEELDEVLDVDWGALLHPRTTLNREGIDHKVEDEDDDGQSRHDQPWSEGAELKHKHMSVSQKT